MAGLIHVRQRKEEYRGGDTKNESNPDRDSVAHHREGQNQSEGNGNKQRNAHGGNEPLGRPSHSLAVVSGSGLACEIPTTICREYLLTDRSAVGREIL